MADFLPIITHVEFFKATYQKKKAKVPARQFSSLTFRLHGKVSVFTTDIAFESSPGMLTFIPAGCPYETEVLEDGEMLIMHFDILNDNENLAAVPLTVLPPHPDVIINLFSRGIRHTQTADKAFAAMADAYRILAEADAAFFLRSPTPNARMQICKQYLDEHLYDPELRIGQLAEFYGSSEVYFRKEFKKYYRLSPLEYVKQNRINFACQLLRTKLYSIAEVAPKSGFDSISYFSAEFRRMVGCSPREYRDF